MGSKQQQCWLNPPKEPVGLRAREGLRGQVVWFGARAAEGAPWLFSLPKALQITLDSTLLCLRPSAKATPERLWGSPKLSID